MIMLLSKKCYLILVVCHDKGESNFLSNLTGRWERDGFGYFFGKLLPQSKLTWQSIVNPSVLIFLILRLNGELIIHLFSITVSDFRELAFSLVRLMKIHPDFVTKFSLVKYSRVTSVWIHQKFFSGFSASLLMWFTCIFHRKSISGFNPTKFRLGFINEITSQIHQRVCLTAQLTLFSFSHSKRSFIHRRNALRTRMRKNILFPSIKESLCWIVWLYLKSHRYYIGDAELCWI